MAADPSSAELASLPDTGSDQSSPIAIFRSLVGSWRGIAEARLSLAMLELVEAGISVSRLLVVALVVAMTVGITWLLCIALGVLWAIQNGYSGVGALAGVIGLHVCTVVLGLALISYQQRVLGARIVRHLAGDK